jgi:hypothetical protein
MKKPPKQWMGSRAFLNDTVKIVTQEQVKLTIADS